ncbi:hypothetical protein CEXT_105081 [Caerostris extrusa]|uniref:Major facilitator superfamily (MFS) profile domain-containing protein n=1 Tax=Caerostris extrusa TaxID=172846 RepID=A0AAV4Q5Y5_CAEEX|nr:hypothetical protein CEXT_105081 [Caerostris extrusa]
MEKIEEEKKRCGRGICMVERNARSGPRSFLLRLLLLSDSRWKACRGVQWQMGVLGISTLIVAVLTLLTPLAARFGVEYLIAIRALEGLAQGVTLPAINYMVGQWAPDSEKGVLNTLVHAGVNVGTIAAMPLTAFLCDSGLFGGWPSAFYIIGLFGCLWFIMWSTLVTDSPLTHPPHFQRRNKIHHIKPESESHSKSTSSTVEENHAFCAILDCRPL